jgi:hypothetical protein
MVSVARLGTLVYLDDGGDPGQLLVPVCHELQRLITHRS